jgi:YbbR domain-containing protein
MRPAAIWPFRHFGLKVLSIGLAILLWMIVAGEETVERGVRVPLEFQQAPEGLELVGEPLTLVDVRVRGSSGALGRMSAADIVAVLDLRTAKPGYRLFQLTPEQVRVPFGVEVLQVNPTTIAMTFEESASRLVPVKPSIEGSPAPGFLIGRIISDPDKVEVAGPASAVQSAAEATTEPVSVSGARETVTDLVTVGILDPLVRLRSPGQATVRVEVLPAPAERTLSGRAVLLRNLGEGLQAQAMPSSVDVVVRGTRQSLNRLGADQVSAFVDLATMGAGDYLLSVKADVQPSSDAGVVRINPEAVKVLITSVQR